jgi:hypothetical protein
MTSHLESNYDVLKISRIQKKKYFKQPKKVVKDNGTWEQK